MTVETSGIKVFPGPVQEFSNGLAPPILCVVVKELLIAIRSASVFRWTGLLAGVNECAAAPVLGLWQALLDRDGVLPAITKVTGKSPRT